MGYPLGITPKNKVLYLMHVDDEEWRISNLIDPNLNWWRRDLIMASFHREDARPFAKYH